MQEETISRDERYRGRLISLRVDHVRLPSGRTTDREIVEHPGAVGILAWDGERLAMVRQWRQAAGATLLEIPAGTREPGEEPAVTAARELAEECGLAANDWRAGPAFYTAPGFCTELLSLYLATELHPVEAAAADDEAIERSWITLPDALRAVEEGRIIDAKSIAGIGWLVQRLAAPAG